MVNAISHIRLGKKYDKIDRGNSGKLMVERSTGEVFGIKAYGKIHRGISTAPWTQSANGSGGHYYPTPVKQVVRIKLTG